MAHLVWATKNRGRLLHPSVDQELANFFRRKAAQLACTLLAAGNADDHVHVLVRYHSECSMAMLVRSLKGASSREHNRTEPPYELSLYGQDGYWAESCGPQAVPGLIRYLHRQRQHHALSQSPEPWELVLFPNR
jgi:putative transposase